MPSNKRPTVAAAATPSPPPKAIAKYINRDGSKVIAVPKMAPSDTAQSSPTSPQAAPTTQPSTAGVNPAPNVNRKKQKKREKAAAKKAALAQEIAAKSSPATPDTVSAAAPDPPCHTNGDIYGQDENSYAAQSQSTRPRVNGTSQASPYPDAEPPAPRSKKNKKKKRGNAGANDQASSDYSYGQTRPDVPARTNNGRIWDNSTTEERDRIKQFWLGLHENERRSLVQIEKAAVLKKMKEQQKQSCSCTVCGRKRTAIEEELEGLYDAYYRELELYATQPAGRFGPMSGLPHPNSTSGMHRPSRRSGAATEVDGEDPEEDDDLGVYSDEADDGHSYSDEDPDDDDNSDRYSFATNFLNFGNNLTVQGGILTVADDLLQNDGRKFIEMMEQLAERRMQREMHGHYHSDHHHYHHHHHHPHSQGHMGSGVFHQPLEEGDDYEDEEDPNDDYEGEVDDDIAYSQDDDYGDDESEDPMTEKERMEEGRRMFQIFAARMFEQRVLKAYRESVSKERSAQLLRELEEEEERKVQAKEAKAQAAQRRKEKEKERKRKQAEEKQRKEAQKKAEQEALRAEKERQAQEQKAKIEEKRRQKELKKKAEEEERLRKEAERQRRLHEQKEREERKARETREARERDRKRKEAQEAQEKAQRDKEARERREQHAQAEKERRAKAAAKERTLKENRKPKNDKHAPTASAPRANTSVAIPLGPKRPRQNHTPIATPLQSRAASAKFASPVVSVALPSVPNPALAKLNVPTRPRVASRSEEEGAQALRKLPNHSESSNPVTPAQPSPGQTGMPPGPHSGGSGQSAGTPGLPLSPHQVMETLSAQPFTFAGPLPPGMHLPPGLQQAMPPPPPGLMQPPGFPPIPAVLRSVPAPGSSTAPMPGTLPMMPPPGLASPTRSLLPPPGFGGPMDPPPGLGHASGPPAEGSPSSHSRHLSSGFDQSPSPHGQQIGRPAPIGRPGSTVAFQRAPGQRGSMSIKTELDETNTHLGSSALLDDDEPLQQGDLPRMATVAPGPGSGLRTPFPSGDPFTSSVFPPGGTWHPPVPSGTFGTPGLGSGGWPAPGSATFGGLVHPLRAPQPRQVTIRQLLCGVCRQLQTTSATADGFLPLSAVISEVDGVSGIEPVTMEELEVLFSTEGNRINGGGVFDTKENETGKKLVRFTEDDGPSVPGVVGAPGGIGSPVALSATPIRSQHAG